MESITYDRFSSSEIAQGEINHTAPKYLPELGKVAKKHLLYFVSITIVEN